MHSTNRIINQQALFIVIGLSAGIILGHSIMFVFQKWYTEQRGIPYRVFMVGNLGFAIALVIIIFVLSYIPTSRHLANMNNIEVLQSDL